jgi:hypothetical protein
LPENNKKPSHRLFIVRNYEKDGVKKSHWTEIGVAFANKQGGLNIQLQAAPLDGRCVALPFEEQPAQ